MKTILYPIISLFLILTISASPIVPLLDKELGKTMVIGGSEEEKSTKLFTIKKFDEADTLIKYFSFSIHQPILQNSPEDYVGYIFPISDYTVEILDPPPRNLV